jgi:hypothetical protein
MRMRTVYTPYLFKIISIPTDLRIFIFILSTLTEASFYDLSIKEFLNFENKFHV